MIFNEIQKFIDFRQYFEIDGLFLITKENIRTCIIYAKSTYSIYFFIMEANIPNAHIHGNKAEFSKVTYANYHGILQGASL